MENQNNKEHVEKTKEEVIDDELDKRLEQHARRVKKAEMMRRSVDILMEGKRSVDLLMEGMKWGMK